MDHVSCEEAGAVGASFFGVEVLGACEGDGGEEGEGERVKVLEKVATREAKRKEGANEKVVRPAVERLRKFLGSE